MTLTPIINSQFEFDVIGMTFKILDTNTIMMLEPKFSEIKIFEEFLQERLIIIFGEKPILFSTKEAHQRNKRKTFPGEIWSQNGFAN